jgi:hypothetical protein
VARSRIRCWRSTQLNHDESKRGATDDSPRPRALRNVALDLSFNPTLGGTRRQRRLYLMLQSEVTLKWSDDFASGRCAHPKAFGRFGAHVLNERGRGARKPNHADGEAQ